jgi:predicted esterase YcpF (UPF0227 family)
LRDALIARGRGAEFVCPQLPSSPRAATVAVLAALKGLDAGAVNLVGSSLGGYYATWLAERTGCRAVLLNPAIRPFDDLRAYLGKQPVYFSDETVDWGPADLDELLALDTPRITRPDRYFLLAATGDEVIDYRTMIAKYAGCRQRVIDGSDHQISDFDQHLEEVLAFCRFSRGEER